MRNIEVNLMKIMMSFDKNFGLWLGLSYKISQSHALQPIWNIWVVKLSFDKVVGHLFSGFMSLVTDKAPPLLASTEETLQIWPVQTAGNRYLRFRQIFFFIVSLHQTGDCEPESMVKYTPKTFHSLCCL